MHYLIKREKCDKCDGRHAYYERSKPEIIVTVSCNCTNGYIETRVDADEWLREKLRELADEK